MNWSFDVVASLVGISILSGALILLIWRVFVFPKIFFRLYSKATAQNDPLRSIIKSIRPAAEAETDEEEIAAVIAAAIEEFSGNEYSSGIVVKNIRRTDNRNPVWNSAGRLESLN